MSPPVEDHCCIQSCRSKEQPTTTKACQPAGEAERPLTEDALSRLVGHFPTPSRLCLLRRCLCAFGRPRQRSTCLHHNNMATPMHLSIVCCMSRTEDNRVMTIQLSKGKAGKEWKRLFRGDPDGARCLQPPYELSGAWLRACMPLPMRQMNFASGA